MDEKELLAYYRETKNLHALGTLYAPYMSLLYGVCFKYLQDQEQSQDAVMQIFEELMGKLLHHRVENFRSWLYVYAKNYCLMQLRKNKRVKHIPLEDNLPEVESYAFQPEPENAPQEQDYRKLEACLDQLSAGQQMCVRLFYLERKCYKDIVEITGYELNQVKSYIQNGKRNLKICMDK